MLTVQFMPMQCSLHWKTEVMKTDQQKSLPSNQDFPGRDMRELCGMTAMFCIVLECG